MPRPDLFNLYCSQGQEALISAIGEAAAAEFLADPETQAALATLAYYQRQSDLTMARRRREALLDALEADLKAATTPTERHDAAWALLRASQVPLLPAEGGTAVPALPRATGRGSSVSSVSATVAPTFRLPSLAPRPPDLAPIARPEAPRSAPLESPLSTKRSSRPASDAASGTLPIRAGAPAIIHDRRTVAHGPHEPAPARRNRDQRRTFPTTGAHRLLSPGPKGHQPVATRVSGWWPRVSAEPQRGDSGRAEHPDVLAPGPITRTPNTRARDRP